MANRRISRIIPIVLVIVIIIIVIVAAISLVRLVFFSGSAAPAQTDVSRQELLNTTAGHSVGLTVRGPIVANEDFHSYNITISPSARTIKTYTGYLDTIVEQQSLGNNTAAYEQFVYALDKANFMLGAELTGESNDIRGICATGEVSSFNLTKDGQPVKTLWTSTCKGSPGSLKANNEQLTRLFVNQIPDASQLIRRAF